MRNLLILLLALAFAAAGQPQARIVLSGVPEYGMEGNLTGRVTGLAPSLYRVHVFLFVPDMGWFGRSCGGVGVDSTGSFSVDVTVAAFDYRATQYAVIVAPPEVSPGCPNWAEALPTVPVLARFVYHRPNPTARVIRFAGLDWTVKSSVNPVGPGPNMFSDSADNVSVDSLGRLHLKITRCSLGRWCSAEVIARRPLGYGTYRLYLDTSVATFAPSTVLGFFTWSESPDANHRELDVELSQWSLPGNLNAQFVVQPYSMPGNMVRFTVPPDPKTAYSFGWGPGAATFEAVRGNTFPAAPADLVNHWSRTGPVPTAQDERLHINFYPAFGVPPPAEQEVIISNFEFLPTDVPYLTYGAALVSPASGRFGSKLIVDVPPREGWQFPVLPPWFQPFPLAGAGWTEVWYNILPYFGTNVRSARIDLPAGTRTYPVTISQFPLPLLDDDQRFTGTVYYQVFGRVPEDTDIDFQVVQALHKGLTRAQMTANLMGSQEYVDISRFVAGLYYGLLGRRPEYAGWLYQRNALARGEVTHRQLVANFLASAEFKLRFGAPADEEMVRLLYRLVLGREASAAEVAAQLPEFGRDPVGFIIAILRSPEFLTRTGPTMTAFLLYGTILQRDGTPDEIAFWANHVTNGMPLQTALGYFIGSPEFPRLLE